jgi:hypothetical protein
MSAYDPPSEIIGQFNSSLFTSTSDNITQSYADSHYLKFPTSQSATETITSLVVNNDATINTISVGKGSTDTSTNVVLGYQSLTSIANNGGDAFNALQNIAIGYQSLPALTFGYQNIAIGSGALSNLSILYKNIAIGTSAGSNVVGGENIAIGDGALFGSAATPSNGNYNTAIGNGALSSNTTGSNNVALGWQAGQAGTANTTGSNNTYVGYQAKANANNYSNSTAIGSGATITSSNSIMLGTSTEKVYIAGNGTYPLPYVIASGSSTFTATATSGRVLLGTFTKPAIYSFIYPTVCNGDGDANSTTFILGISVNNSGQVYISYINATYPPNSAFRANYVIYAIM